MRWWLIGLCVWFLGCTRPCDGSTCAGCCDEGGQCLEGTRRAACGLGGSACARCPNGDVCVEGLCFAGPAPDGGLDAGVVCVCSTACCLADGTCAPSNVPEACGPARAFCGACEVNQRCEGTRCVAQGCPGCFDPVGLCRAGNEHGACGGDAGLCLACAGDEGCVDGGCRKLRCDAANCRFGCCLPDNTCVATPTDAQCGLSGSMCHVCVGTATCVAGLCR